MASLLSAGLLLAAAPALAADPGNFGIPGALPAPGPGEVGPLSPRYFPRGDESEQPPRYGRPRARPVGCVVRRVPVPTNAPDDPSYVGSSYGLSHPSYYGLTPPPGVDDPFGRPLLPYCP